MLKKISVMRMERGLGPMKDGPAAPSRDPDHAADRIDNARMPDRFQHRQVAGTVAVHEAGAQVEPFLGGEPLGYQSLALAVGIRLDHTAGKDRVCALQPARDNMIHL